MLQFAKEAMMGSSRYSYKMSEAPNESGIISASDSLFLVTAAVVAVATIILSIVFGVGIAPEVSMFAGP